MAQPAQPAAAGGKAPRFIFPKLMYFILFAGMACARPFLPYFYATRGLGDVAVGVLTCLPPFVEFFAGSFWSLVADKTRRHTVILLGTMLAGTGVLQFFQIAHTFWTLTACVVAYSFFYAPMLPLVDSWTLGLLGNFQHLYGKQRLWGAASWGSAAALVGILVTKYGINVIFYSYAVGLIASFVFLAVYLRSTGGSVGGKRKTPFQWSLVRKLVGNRSVFFFYFTVLFLGMGLSIAQNFLFIYLEQELHASSTLMGLSVLATVIPEFPLFFFAPQLLTKLRIPGMIILSQCAFVVRVLGYTFLTNPWWVLVIEPLHGVAYAAMWAAGVAYANSVAPPGLEATAQALLSGVFSGLGFGTGALLGGIIAQSFGYIVLFRSIGAAVFLSMLVFIAAIRRDKTMSGDVYGSVRQVDDLELTENGREAVFSLLDEEDDGEVVGELAPSPELHAAPGTLALTEDTLEGRPGGSPLMPSTLTAGDEVNADLAVAEESGQARLITLSPRMLARESSTASLTATDSAAVPVI